MRRRGSLGTLGLPVFLLAGVVYLQAGAQQTPGSGPVASASPTATSSPDRELLGKYCAGCHNEKSKQGNFVISSLDVDNVASHAERWELVVRKLRARSMPPVGRPRPTEEAYESLARPSRSFT